MPTYIIFLNPVRKTFNQDATPEESALVGEHFTRIKTLHEQGVITFVGLTDSDYPTGIVVFDAPDCEAAEAMLNDDPAVKAGVFRGEVHLFRQVFPKPQG